MNFDSKFTLLTEEQILEDIEIMRKLGSKCAITDFAILLGAYVSDEYHVDDDDSLKGRTGWYYTASSYGNGDVHYVHEDGSRYWGNAGMRSGGIRPALPFSDISLISPNIVRGAKGIFEIEYGEYPQYAASESF